MDERSARDDEARQTAALMGFIVILVLAIAGVVLVRELTANAKLEDCLMSGRRNCAPHRGAVAATLTRRLAGLVDATSTKAATTLIGG